MNYGRIIKRLPLNVRSFINQEPGWILPNLLLTYNCTQRCLQCSIPHKACPEMVIHADKVDLICDSLLQYGTQGLSISGGDPLSHPELISLLEQIARKGFSFLHLLTNLYGSTRLIDELIPVLIKNRIHITTSFDGFGEVADKIRGGKDVSRRVSESMLKISQANFKAKKKIQTRGTMVVSQMNLHQVEDVIRFFEELNWELSIDIYRYSSIQHLDEDQLHIKDLDGLESIIEKCIQSNNVVTPRFLLKGYVNYLKGDFPKKCPYLDSPTLGSKFFIQPNGDVLVCQGGSIGNLLEQTPKEIIKSEKWADRLASFKSCEGCWNPCYTTFSGYTAVADMGRRLRKVARSRKDSTSDNS